MKILFITRLFSPHVGGVEKHVYEISKKLKIEGEKLIVLTENYNSKLKDREIIGGARVVRFSYPHIKFLGLISIWFCLLKNRRLIVDADIIHIHDVFVWYLPFKFLYPNKKVITTFHGLEWEKPLSIVGVWQKKLAKIFSNKTVGVGKFLEKYLKVEFDLLIYGAATLLHSTVAKTKNTIVYVGRLEENTGVLEFLKSIKNNKFKIDFCGDGPLRKECEKYGIVHGFTDPTPFLKKAEYCVPGGYLAALEGLAANCKLKLFWNNKVKEDYWKMSPFYKLKGEALKKWAKEQTWDKLADQYLDLYKTN